MFEYAIGHYQKHPPSRRLLASWVISVLGHAAAVLILYLYPQLLQGGTYNWFRQPPLTPAQSHTPKWRNLTFVAKMEIPPPEELKKYVYDWNQKKKTEGTLPPIRINLPRGIMEELSAPLPIPRPTIPGNPPVTATTTPAVTPATIPAADGARKETTEAKKPAITGPPDVAPKQIPKGVTDATQPSGTTATSASAGTSQPGSRGAGAQNARDPNQQVSAQGGLFDTKGFPLEEYANLIRELVKQKWLIPSNLRDYQGSVTVVFYIGKDGHITGAKIETGSGNQTLDITALSAVLQSNPLPSLPTGFPAERVGARLVFAYNQRQ
jgi:TonB family protein